LRAGGDHAPHTLGRESRQGNHMAGQMAHTASAGMTAAAAHTRPVRVWLLTVAALIFLLVSIGGATRLTGSGLSITEWQPIMGIVPPLSDAAWQEAFAKYKQIPQYQLVNKGMSLAAFKTIFWWEWTHRFLARLVGFVFAVPFVVFLAMGRIPRTLLGRLAGIFALGGLQGAIGWYMVSSGLSERTSVSQYRLALHLSLAILIFGAVLWVAMSLGQRKRETSGAPQSLRRGAALLVGLVFVQIVVGAFVAGLRAGAGYNTWPLMEGQLIPQGLGALSPWWANLFENALTVQFNHRVLAYVLAGAVLWHCWSLMRVADLPRAHVSGAALAFAVLVQIGIGIWTLLARVPLELGLAHQAGAVAVFGLALWHLHRLRHG
jgi:cytochrome c oxidase assembly protein subunit 15